MSTSERHYRYFPNDALVSLVTRLSDGATVEAAGREGVAGLINYNRGDTQILDRGGLETAACECYRAVKNRFKLLVSDGNDGRSISHNV
jgi:hypothetical protein